MVDNTFLGLQPYTEDDAYRFKGRTEESQELFRLIVRNDFTVCYAESGEGKTSLLNAGVFPLLRENMYFPITITFTSDDYQVTPDSFDAIIDRCIKDSIAEYNEKNKGANVKYALCSTDFQGIVSRAELQRELSEYSWWKLRNYRPQTIGLTFTPVFVFDQFEEVFNLPSSLVWTKRFFDWLEDVSSDCCPDFLVERVRVVIGDKAAFPIIKEEKGFKAVFSLRKEFIGELDYWGMQKCFIPGLKDNRYCLKPLTYEGAKKVMTQLKCFDEGKVEQVLTHFVGQYSREPERTISENLPVIPALLLSVVCDSLEKDIAAFSELNADEICQSLNKILEKFYNETIDSIVNDIYESSHNTSSHSPKYDFARQNCGDVISPEALRNDIETAMFDLVDINGKRVRLKAATNLGTIQLSKAGNLPTDELRIIKYKKILNDKRIIKITKVDNEDYVEIVHDALCPIITKRKEIWFEAEAKIREGERLRELAKKNQKRILLLLGVVLVAFTITGFFLYQNAKIKEQCDIAETSEAEAVLVNVNNLVSKGQLIDAATILGHIVDNLNSKYNDKIRGRALITLRDLYSTYIYGGQYDKFIAHNGQVCDMGFNSDGSLIATSSNDRTIRIWSTVNGELIKEYPKGPDVRNVWSSSDVNAFFDEYDKRNPICQESCYKTITSISPTKSIWERRGGANSYPNRRETTVLSPDGSLSLIEKDGKVLVYNGIQLVKAIEIDSKESIKQMEFAFDNSRFLLFGRNKDICDKWVKEYNIDGKQLKHVDFSTHETVYGCVYLPNTYDILFLEYEKGPFVIKEDEQIIPYHGGMGIEAVAINPIAKLSAFGGKDGSLALRHYEQTPQHKSADHTDSLFFVAEMEKYDSGMEIHDGHIRDTYRGLSLKSLEDKAYIVDENINTEIALIGHQNNIGNVIFNKTHDMVITRAFDNTIRFWSVKTGKEIDSLRIRVSGYGNQSIACSPDNKYLVSSSDDMLYVWEIQTGNIVFSMPYKDINYSCFSKTGDKILFTSGFSNKEKDIKCVDFLGDEELLEWFKKMPKRKKSESSITFF